MGDDSLQKVQMGAGFDETVRFNADKGQVQCANTRIISSIFEKSPDKSSGASEVVSDAGDSSFQMTEYTKMPQTPAPAMT